MPQPSRNTFKTHAVLAGLGAGLLSCLPLWVMAEDQASESPPLPGISIEQVAQHADEQSCWMAIGDGVYDVTEFLPLHPGPEGWMRARCGLDATQDWETKTYGAPHSPAAHSLLELYRIGNLDP